MKKALLICGLCFVLAFPAFAAKENYPFIQIVKNDGGKIHGAEESQNNTKSSLRLEWYVLNDPGCPVQLMDAGVKEYEQVGAYPKNYHYQADIQMKVYEPVAAYQVKFNLYNVFGQFLTELVVQDVRDLESKEIYQQHEYFAKTEEKNSGALLKVIAYISSIRKADGSVWNYNKTPINQIIADLTATK